MVNYHRRIMKHIIFSIIFLIANTTLLAYDANSAANAQELAISDISCRLIPNTQNIEDEVGSPVNPCVYPYIIDSL